MLSMEAPKGWRKLTSRKSNIMKLVKRVTQGKLFIFRVYRAMQLARVSSEEAPECQEQE